MLMLMMLMPTPLLLPLLLLLATASALSAGRGFGPPGGAGAFAAFDRFRVSRPAGAAAIRRFDPSLVAPDDDEEDVWVAVYRSANNLPSVLVRDAFFDAMASATAGRGGDSDTLVSPPPPSSSSGVLRVSDSGGGGDGSRPVAVARMRKSAQDDGVCIMDSMRCALKKEKTDAGCDGGSEHAEAIGACIDELVLSYLEAYLESNGPAMAFDGGIRFRGTLVSGKLLDSRGFREASTLSADMHSHESDYDGALRRYAERSTSTEAAKSPGARDRALRIVSCLGRADREQDKRRARARDGGDARDSGDKEDGEGSDFDPWASVKRYL